MHYLIHVRYLKECNAFYGHHFFDADTLRFFSTRLSEIVIGASRTCALFVTSERNTWGNHPRKYTVRKIDHATGDVTDVSEFQEYKTLAAAKGRLRREIANY